MNEIIVVGVNYYSPSFEIPIPFLFYFNSFDFLLSRTLFHAFWSAYSTYSFSIVCITSVVVRLVEYDVVWSLREWNYWEVDSLRHRDLVQEQIHYRGCHGNFWNSRGDAVHIKLTLPFNWIYQGVLDSSLPWGKWNWTLEYRGINKTAIHPVSRTAL